MLRQSVFGRLAGYEDVNDAERLRHDPAMRWIVGGKAVVGRAASPSQIGRFETQWFATDKDLSALADLSGQWIDLVHGHRPPRGFLFDMDSSVSPTHGEQENSVWTGHYACTCYHPLFVFNQFGDLECCALRPGNVHSADGWKEVLDPVVQCYRGKVTRIYFRADAAFAMPEVYELRLQLHALAYNLANFLRTLATPEPMSDWSLTTLKEKLIKIGAKVVSHGRYSCSRWPRSQSHGR